MLLLRVSGWALRVFYAAGNAMVLRMLFYGVLHRDFGIGCYGFGPLGGPKGMCMVRKIDMVVAN